MAPGARHTARIVAATLLSAVLLLRDAQAEGIDTTPTRVELDLGATRFTLTLRATLHTVEGTFLLKHGTVMLDPATGEAGGLVIVDATSAKSGNDTRDAAMRNDVLET